MKKPIIKESDFQEQIRQLANLYGWLYYHTHRSTFSPSGFPDTVMVRLEPESRIIFAELKVGDNQPTIDQYIWLEILQHLPKPVEAYLWYPDDWDDIVKVMEVKHD